MAVRLIWLWEESMLKSIITDTFTVIAFCAPPIIGWALNIVALEWVGAVLAFLMILYHAQTFGTERRMTPQRAADYLLYNYGVSARQTKEGVTNG
jgi:hypothetical protein